MVKERFEDQHFLGAWLVLKKWAVFDKFPIIVYHVWAVGLYNYTLEIGLLLRPKWFWEPPPFLVVCKELGAHVCPVKAARIRRGCDNALVVDIEYEAHHFYPFTNRLVPVPCTLKICKVFHSVFETFSTVLWSTCLPGFVVIRFLYGKNGRSYTMYYCNLPQGGHVSLCRRPRIKAVSWRVYHCEFLSHRHIPVVNGEPYTLRNVVRKRILHSSFSFTLTIIEMLEDVQLEFWETLVFNQAWVVLWTSLL